ncbi:type II toxin-antitoxin system CcdA family antitoxin [uncultured Roseibium sp.]|uniref:type II toxin-antitoxin system CcdA family antitoxin n=1 Tax=uncultured Roseibium sp. TaxID=1936171 RepID=UPI003216EF4A
MPSKSPPASTIPVNQRLAAQARDLKLDLTRAAEEGLDRAIKAERERLWRLDNEDAIRAANSYVEKNGLPFAKFRQF